MTIIFNSDNFWIEYLEFEESEIAAGGLYDKIKLLERTGKFIGGSAVNTPPAGQFGKELSGIIFQGRHNNIAINNLGYGVEIDGIRALTNNEESSQSNIIRLSAIIFLRK